MPRIKQVIEDKQVIQEKNRQDNLDYLEARGRVIKLMCQFFNPRNDIDYASEIEEIADGLIEAAVLKCHLCYGEHDAALKERRKE